MAEAGKWPGISTDGKGCEPEHVVKLLTLSLMEVNMDGVAIVQCLALIVLATICISLVRRVEQLEQNQAEIVKASLSNVKNVQFLTETFRSLLEGVK